MDAPLSFWEYWRWFLTYLTPVPVWIFFEQIIGRGWKSSIRRIWQIQIIFVIVAVALGIILRSPGTAMVANNVMAIVGILVVGSHLFRPDLGITRELRMLKIGGAAWAMTALYENIAPLLTPGYDIAHVEPIGQFVFLGCLALVAANRFFQNQIATYAGAGNPPLLLWRESEQKIYEYRENGVILGQFEDVRYQNIELRLKSGDRFFMYTDGIIEAANAAGELYGWHRFKEYIASHAHLTVGNFADAFMQCIYSWSGKHLDEALDDDLTLVVAEFKSS